MADTTSTTGSPASPGSATAARRHRKKPSGKKMLSPRTRENAYRKYQAFLGGLALHGHDAGFPNLFADGSVAAKMKSFVEDAVAIDAARADKLKKNGVSRAAQTKGDAVLDAADGAIVGFYGPASTTLTDFGMRPLHRKERRTKHKPAATAPGGA